MGGFFQTRSFGISKETGKQGIGRTEMSLVNVVSLKRIAEVEFSDFVSGVDVGLNHIRIILKDKSFIDVWYSLNIKGRYSYHWERRPIDGTIYRHNNAPHKRWKDVSTFPRHFHYKSELNVKESLLSDEPESALREFLWFVSEKL